MNEHTHTRGAALVELISVWLTHLVVWMCG